MAVDGRTPLTCSNGFSLIELVIGIIVLAVALVTMLTMIFPQASRSVDPFHQVRASELGHSLLNEILTKKFDECSGHTGDERSDTDCSNNPAGSYRCDEAGPAGVLVACIATIPTCPASGMSAATEEGNDRATYNDVDDYHCLDQSGDQIENALGEPLTDFYQNYRLQVSVAYDGAALGLANNRAAKRVTILVTLPSGEQIAFSGYRGNY
ncbi:prepilin-type N-terminal cleavage/methylation domain-containing protein [Corallincola luteus]|uniref:Prepilin-type N-terminal cleavage/methylation domain-containing protein n=1 Tax=Corallincola luteus TaxID=1775177 RepID=A0ABY2AN89_9GAMM|nr:prepilin-type N-terminal cleavage/methylation domain-containing protein [Corallincola luteus]TCI03532.1 prepilin-type N-terminal cleavage/methylation domain-containing protein [Corallincola luteus]